MMEGENQQHIIPYGESISKGRSSRAAGDDEDGRLALGFGNVVSILVTWTSGVSVMFWIQEQMGIEKAQTVIIGSS